MAMKPQKREPAIKSSWEDVIKTSVKNNPTSKPKKKTAKKK
jgi:hypothetical protein